MIALLKEKQEEIKQALVTSVPEPAIDSFLRGKYAAYEEMISIEFQDAFTEETVDD